MYYLDREDFLRKQMKQDNESRPALCLCKCEHYSHTNTCHNEATQTVGTIYGPYDLCSSCANGESHSPIPASMLQKKEEGKRIAIYRSQQTKGYGFDFIGEVVAKHDYAVELGVRASRVFSDFEPVHIYANGYLVW